MMCKIIDRDVRTIVFSVCKIIDRQSLLHVTTCKTVGRHMKIIVFSAYKIIDRQSLSQRVKPLVETQKSLFLISAKSLVENHCHDV